MRGWAGVCLCLTLGAEAFAATGGVAGQNVWYPEVAHVKHVKKDGAPYGIDDVLQIRLLFERQVELACEPRLTLNLGEFGEAAARYVSNDGTSLYFEYTVQERDRTWDGGELRIVALQGASCIHDFQQGHTMRAAAAAAVPALFADRYDVFVDGARPNLSLVPRDGEGAALPRDHAGTYWFTPRTASVVLEGACEVGVDIELTIGDARGEWLACVGGWWSAPLALSSLAFDGSTVLISATQLDAAGNVAHVPAVIVKRENTAPSVASVAIRDHEGGQAPVPNEIVTCEVAVDDPDGDVVDLEYQWFQLEITDGLVTDEVLVTVTDSPTTRVPFHAAGRVTHGRSLACRVLASDAEYAGEDATVADGPAVEVQQGQTSLVAVTWDHRLGSRAAALTPLGDRLAFMANDALSGTALYVTDGTESGTSRIVDPWPGFQDPVVHHSQILTPFSLGERLFFEARGEDFVYATWTTDGTESAVLLGGADDPRMRSDAFVLLEPGRAMFATTVNPISLHEYNTELWVSDGTIPGTYAVAAFQSVRSLVPWQGAMLVEARLPGDYFYRLFRTDGTVAGTTEVLGPLVDGVVTAGDQLYWRAWDRFPDPTYAEVWTADGTWVPTVIPGSRGTASSGLRTLGEASLGDARYGVTIDPGTRHELLWEIAPDGARVLADLGGFERRTNPPVALGDQLLIVAEDGVLGRELWAWDPTTETLSLVADINPGFDGSEPLLFRGVEVDGVRYFQARGPNGHEMWRTDGTPEGTFEAVDLLRGGDSFATDFEVLGRSIYFVAGWPDQFHRELFRFDLDYVP